MVKLHQQYVPTFPGSVGRYRHDDDGFCDKLTKASDIYRVVPHFRKHDLRFPTNFVQFGFHFLDDPDVHLQAKSRS